jgi:hypothetical protein
MKKHTYSVYDWREEPHKHIKNVSERTEISALAVSGFGSVVSQGGKIERQSANEDKEITRIMVYLPESVSAGKIDPDFVMERLY